MDITGKIIAILPEVTGQGQKGAWVKQDFVVEVDGKYPKKVCIGTWNGNLHLDTFNVGDTVTVSFDIESKEHNGRYFTNLSGWKMVRVGGATAAQSLQQNNNNSQEAQSDNLPF